MTFAMIFMLGDFSKVCKLSFVEKPGKFLLDVPNLLALLQNLKFVEKNLLHDFNTLVVLDKAQDILNAVWILKQSLE